MTFQEKQKFIQWWLWLIIFTLTVISFMPKENNSFNYVYILFGCLIPIFFYLMELRIKVDNIGIHYQFYPFHIKYNTFFYNEITKIEAVMYKPILEYGGWGIKQGFKGKAYNVHGKYGVKIYLKSGKNVLFGSQKHIDFAVFANNELKNHLIVNKK